MSTPERHCTSSRDGKVVLSCWIPEGLRQELDRVWAEQGLRPHGRTQKGMESMIRAYLANHAAGKRSSSLLASPRSRRLSSSTKSPP